MTIGLVPDNTPGIERVMSRIEYGKFTKDMILHVCRVAFWVGQPIRFNAVARESDRMLEGFRVNRHYIS